MSKYELADFIIYHLDNPKRIDLLENIWYEDTGEVEIPGSP